MECTRKAFIGLVALALAAATPALAQDTTTTDRTPQPGQDADSLTLPGQGGAADTAGYSGMEREDPTGARSDTTGGVETGAVPTDTSADQADTSAQAAAPQPAGEAAGASKDPNGFRWTEPGDFARAGQTPPVGATDAVQPKEKSDDSAESGAVKPSDPTENPPGYRGMERDTTQVPPGAVEDAATPTSRTEQMERQTEESGDQNPPGYRGMEQPAETSDSTKSE